MHFLAVATAVAARDAGVQAAAREYAGRRLREALWSTMPTSEQ